MHINLSGGKRDVQCKRRKKRDSSHLRLFIFIPMMHLREFCVFDFFLAVFYFCFYVFHLNADLFTSHCLHISMIMHVSERVHRHTHTPSKEGFFPCFVLFSRMCQNLFDFWVRVSSVRKRARSFKSLKPHDVVSCCGFVALSLYMCLSVTLSIFINKIASVFVRTKKSCECDMPLSMNHRHLTEVCGRGRRLNSIVKLFARISAGKLEEYVRWSMINVFITFALFAE